MEIRSSTSAIPYSAPAAGQPQPTVGNDTSRAASPETPSSIVTLQSRPDAAKLATDAASSGSNAAGEPSPIKSFAYGALGLPEPQPPAEAAAKPENTYFTAGKWVAAAATVGSIVSLLV